MESVILAAAILVGAVVIAASRRGAPALAPRPPADFRLLAGPAAPLDLPLAAVVPGQPAVRVFSRRAPPSTAEPARPGSPAHYTLTLARGGYGRWRSALDGPTTGAGQPGVLTLTLDLPWSDIARSYSAIDLVLK